MRYIYQNWLDKACFQYDMAYGNFKDLSRSIFVDKVLCNKAFTAKDLKYDRYQHGLASMFCKFFNKKAKKTSGSSIKKRENFK